MQLPLSPSVNLDMFLCKSVGAGDHASMCNGKKRRFWFAFIFLKIILVNHSLMVWCCKQRFGMLPSVILRPTGLWLLPEPYEKTTYVQLGWCLADPHYWVFVFVEHFQEENHSCLDLLSLFMQYFVSCVCHDLAQPKMDWSFFLLMAFQSRRRLRLFLALTYWEQASWATLHCATCMHLFCILQSMAKWKMIWITFHNEASWQAILCIWPLCLIWIIFDLFSRIFTGFTWLPPNTQVGRATVAAIFFTDFR